MQSNGLAAFSLPLMQRKIDCQQREKALSTVHLPQHELYIDIVPF